LPALNPVALRSELPRPWRQLEVIEQTGSTNSDLVARAAAGENVEGIVLLAEHQTAGRGRAGRSWLTVPGGQIAMSVGVAANAVPSDRWGWLPLATGLAVVDTVSPLTSTPIGLKWPNDVLAPQGKLAGILAEVASPYTVIVVGLGLNVAHHPDPAAVSLTDVGVATTDRNELIPALLSHLGDRIEQWRSANPRLIEDYRARSVTLGYQVRARLPGDREVVGTARSVDAEGRIVIDSDGRDVAVSAGDVVHLRR